jgi:hypothetical protein
MKRHNLRNPPVGNAIKVSRPLVRWVEPRFLSSGITPGNRAPRPHRFDICGNPVEQRLQPAGHTEHRTHQVMFGLGEGLGAVNLKGGASQSKSSLEKATSSLTTTGS